ncbi:(2Fe-2S)-binding protein [Streptomyces sp. JJ38]|uniref:(2Fe-2S)-binding protein n=1 Tax=Streptomyces sp. JJ38 TaxID=2738128 RepID=UPI001C55B3E6|nr:(2Fe-2S)-binding protein [Streptomyces sp. JJ38]MBW1598542.1 (2Fe-2S)-binding protein [Streptomyces sp. JJ38]
MSNDPHPASSAPPQGGWGGEYDGDATAFIQLPPRVAEGGHEDPAFAGQSPLAAPGTGQGWEPPVIPPPTPAATTDPADTGTWTMPFAAAPAPAPADAPDAAAPADAAAGQIPYTAAHQDHVHGAEFGRPATGTPGRSAAAALGQGAAAALAGSHEGRLHADAGAAGQGAPDAHPHWSEPSPSSPQGPGHPPAAPFVPAPAAAPDAQPQHVPAAVPGSESPHPTVPHASAPEPGAPESALPEPGAREGAGHVPEDALGPGAPAELPAQPEPQAEAADEHPLTSYTLHVNGSERHVGDVWIGESLLHVLRERLGLAGAKDGCSQGECGACSVLVDGRLVASCLVPAATAAGSEIRTVEGLTADGVPSDVQRALAARSSGQCGFCVPGMAMTAHDLLEGNHAPTDLQIRTALCGNLCRCSGYRGAIEAIREVAAERAAHARPERGEAGADAESGAPRIPQQAGPSDEGDPQ